MKRILGSQWRITQKVAGKKYRGAELSPVRRLRGILHKITESWGKIMELEVRLVYILEILLANVPANLLRFYAFRRELRMPGKFVLGGFALLILAKVVYLNYANWPYEVGIGDRQRLFMTSTVALNVFFFIAIRPFWRHVFVVGVLSVYSMMVLYPPSWLVGSAWLGGGLPAHVAGCSLMLAGVGLSWGFMKRWVTEGVVPFFQNSTENFLRYFWIMPFLFVFSVVLFSLGTAGSNRLDGAVVVASLAGGLGMVAAFRFMKRGIVGIRANHIFEANRALMSELRKVRRERLRAAAAAFARERRMQQIFGKDCNLMLEQAEKGEWQALAEAVQACRSSLAVCPRELGNNHGE